ncbi:hypothetical protein F2P81_000368 [Scophthalmus maximus]|uniref:Uncharacterized protein n=1 Tax=Scophthalmus maximus TaxID=52904 RepID=A0A6A4TN46_SCOMX|nr:hypothetical protein F2P81_000368 [Scophthalmus maximus]
MLLPLARHLASPVLSGVYVEERKRSAKLKKQKSTAKGAPLPKHKTLLLKLLKHLVSGPADTSVTLRQHDGTEVHKARLTASD